MGKDYHKYAREVVDKHQHTEQPKPSFVKKVQHKIQDYQNNRRTNDIIKRQKRIAHKKVIAEEEMLDTKIHKAKQGRQPKMTSSRSGRRSVISGHSQGMGDSLMQGNSFGGMDSLFGNSESPKQSKETYHEYCGMNNLLGSGCGSKGSKKSKQQDGLSSLFG